MSHKRNRAKISCSPLQEKFLTILLFQTGGFAMTKDISKGLSQWVRVIVTGIMFLNPWYLQQQAAKQQQLQEQLDQEAADVTNQNLVTSVSSLDSTSLNSASPQSSQESGRGSSAGGPGDSLSYSPSPAPSVVSAGSCGSGHSANHNNSNNSNNSNSSNSSGGELSAIQSSLKPGWTVHITPEGRLYYCK